jgi:glycosyltransferase involved in cell wall biosynthesis
MTPRVSILMPVHNEARYLPQALASLQRQTLRDWELVAVDNGSSDATPQLLATAARLDERIRVLTLPAPGLVNALNSGLAACRAELVARMDGDDICHPQRLQRQVDALRADPTLGLVACRVRHFPRPQLTDGMRAYEAWQNQHLDHAAIMADRFVESPFTHPSVCLRRAALEAVGGYRACGWPEDYDLWLRLAHAGLRFTRLPETLFFWRDRPERLTRSCADYTLAAFRACKVHHLKNDYLKGHHEVTLWGAGQEGKAWRQALADEGIAVTRWIEVDKRKIGQCIHGAPVVGLDALRPGDGPLLITIGARAARPQVRAFTQQAGLVEERDFVCVT